MSSIAASDPAPPAHLTETWVRQYAVERAEGISALRGLLVGVALSLPLWALLVAGAGALVSNLP